MRLDDRSEAGGDVGPERRFDIDFGAGAHLSRIGQDAQESVGRWSSSVVRAGLTHSGSKATVAPSHVDTQMKLGGAARVSPNR
jgi:hypothetical protein